MDAIVGLLSSVIIALCICQCYNYFNNEPVKKKKSKGNGNVLLFKDIEEHDKFLGENKNKKILVNYLMKNCGYCDKLIPALQQIAQEAKDRDDIIIAATDGASEPRYGFDKYPTVILYADGGGSVVNNPNYHVIRATLNMEY